MAKAINWPEEFYNEVINEDSDSPKVALRLGTLYYDNGYYVPNEVVDIRVNHKLVRNAQIIDNLSLVKIEDLSEDILSKYKSSLRTKENIIDFLTKTYNQPVNDETTVTLITYRNLPQGDNDRVDDPHIN